MSYSWLARFGAVCGVILGLSIGVPGLIEAFTGETAATSFVIGLGAVFGPAAVTAFHLHQSAASGRFGRFAYAVNLLGAGLFSGVGFTLNLVFFFLEQDVVAELMRGPTKIAVLGGVALFVVGSLLFTASMVRARIFPRLPAWGYGLTLTLLAALAQLPDTPATSAVHVLVCVSLIWLSWSVLTATAVAAPVPSGLQDGRLARP